MNLRFAARYKIISLSSVATQHLPHNRTAGQVCLVGVFCGDGEKCLGGVTRGLVVGCDCGCLIISNRYVLLGVVEEGGSSSGMVESPRMPGGRTKHHKENSVGLHAHLTMFSSLLRPFSFAQRFGGNSSLKTENTPGLRCNQLTRHRFFLSSVASEFLVSSPLRFSGRTNACSLS